MAYRDQPLGELALSIPRASALFRKYDMDYCCGGKQTLARAAARKELDVEVIEAELEVIKHTTNNVTPPPEACTTWKAMYNGINELIDDLMDHISLENNVLFPRALAGE